MATTFTIRVNGKEGQQYEVDLGVDILEGKSLETIRAMAEDSAVIALQGKIRKGAKDSMESIEEYLRKNGYADAYVQHYEATESETALAKKLIKILGKEEAMRIIADRS